MAASNFSPSPGSSSTIQLTKLWIYTNYDCNLRCSYCVAESSPQAARRSLSPADIQRLVVEAAMLGFEQVYFTGGEPFLLEDIYASLAYAAQHMQTTVLTNAMLLHGKRLEKLCAIRSDNLIVQVSLDGSNPLQHDPYRGEGSWEKTVAGLRNLQECGFRVRLATTQTPANQEHMAKICAYHLALGIAEEDHLIRPLAKRGFSLAGMDVCKQNLTPELTVSQDGIYWHPLSTDSDMQVSARIFPLAAAVSQVQAELVAFSQAELQSFQ